MYLRSGWFIQELRDLKCCIHFKMVKYIFKRVCVIDIVRRNSVLVTHGS